MVVADDKTPHEYGRRLREAREAEGFTQTELGNLFGFSNATISRTESGQMSPTMLVFIILFFIFLSKHKNLTEAASKVKRLYPLTGKRLKKKRLDMGLSVTGLARELGLTRKTIHKYERGYFDSNVRSYRWLALEMEVLKGELAEREKQEAA